MNDSMFALENSFGNDETQNLETVVGRVATGLGRRMTGGSVNHNKKSRGRNDVFNVEKHSSIVLIKERGGVNSPPWFADQAERWGDVN